MSVVDCEVNGGLVLGLHRIRFFSLFYLQFIVLTYSSSSDLHLCIDSRIEYLASR